MPLYINDPEVARLADQLCQQTGSSKTEIVRRLLREEARRLDRIRTACDRIHRIEEISRRASEILRRTNPKFTYGKKEADEMFSYLEAESKPIRHKSRKKADGD